MDYRRFEKTSNQITDEYEKMFEGDEPIDIVVENFSFIGEIEISVPLIWGKIVVDIQDGELSEILEINDVCILARDGMSHKHFINPYGFDRSLCRWILWNFFTGDILESSFNEYRSENPH